MKNEIIIEDQIVTKDIIDKIEIEIKKLEESGVYDMGLMSHYQYLYNIAWMKLYSQLDKDKQNIEIENGKKREKRESRETRN